jgi:hypothetical protein
MIPRKDPIMRSNAETVVAYLAELTDDRRATVSAVRAVIVKNLPAGLIETMGYGMINYVVPAEKSPKSCNGQPMMLIGLSSGKQYCSLHLMCLYMNPPAQDAFRKEFDRIGKKLDMGKACVRFKRAEDLPLEAIGKLVAKIDPAKFAKMYEMSHSKEARAERSKKRKAAAK